MLLFQIFDSPRCLGRGVRVKAGHTLAQGQVACEYKGELVTEAEGKQREAARPAGGMAYATFFLGRPAGAQAGSQPVHLW